ncbi:MAG: bifunctional phosphopantothenoylcysteine decarboxylase/phosphopantothenate--cysteine ligase CoaBC [Lachnospiraceae bacterium]|jgi:phosphopantothenoylcysteine decarboxylase/phosphopantothenate--cysteine ligase|nr:bifunctional phosphopantothenoylcysteine decarboxylase/phosphopantothenate--cysteine ligase CoaBC [Lachnospiraceae bacterium]MCH4030713.1 bifunctional phosphopantothenoylcysteine decarboxylase/phosphopantothenate--cysteine ligase CoaBC [Lachnospiraceae bacterium]MCH4070685.1 bifunctional phosphopantothenoylcysteine decarboxylase/phosphopantothenate--cysteine ligase CoaBC [Lachnospiraceae bacterium]MCH4107139.1 bifunctional phosphopantothenoylcysteine decarboxylase/phosphopantothenate--cystein
MLKGKHVLLGVSGSIAAYKAADLASRLVKAGCDVHVLMTENACHFINPIAFETLTSNKCLVDTFDRNFQYSVEHVSLAAQADVFITAPASADVLAKFACGIADDMLTTTWLACECPKIAAPAMNTRMYRNPVTQDNLKRLSGYGVRVLTPANGRLACGETGDGKLPDVSLLFEAVRAACEYKKDYAGRKVLVTAGPTVESIDPVRFISNHSTGRMGYCLAENAMLRGADVTLVSGPVSLPAVPWVRMVPVQSARDMFEACMEYAPESDIIIKAAAVADYTPVTRADEKIKKGSGDLTLNLKRTDDILGQLGKNRRQGQFLCGFSMETENLIENSRKKLQKKNVDMICANSLRTPGAGFGTDTNVVTVITRDSETQLPLMSKSETAEKILDLICAQMQ